MATARSTRRRFAVRAGRPDAAVPDAGAKVRPRLGLLTNRDGNLTGSWRLNALGGIRHCPGWRIGALLVTHLHAGQVFGRHPLSPAARMRHGFACVTVSARLGQEEAAWATYYLGVEACVARAEGSRSTGAGAGRQRQAPLWRCRGESAAEPGRGRKAGWRLARRHGRTRSHGLRPAARRAWPRSLIPRLAVGLARRGSARAVPPRGVRWL
jgi:hypothetical protein